MRTYALAGAVLVLLVPGSGWRGVDAYDGERMAIPESTWRSWGFRTQVVPYGPGQTGRDDVAEALRGATARRVCLYGESSGGTWALLAAANVPGAADCVVVSAAPTDEDTWRRSRRRVARSFAHRIWPAFFGTARADDLFEPLDVWQAQEPDLPALYLAAAGDPTVPPQQGRIFGRVGARVRVLRRGDYPFVHGGARAGDVRAAKVAARRFVRGR